MGAIRITDGSDATTVLFNDTKLVTDQTVGRIWEELHIAIIGAMRSGVLVLDFDGVELISLSMVRCLLSTVKSARSLVVKVHVRNIGYRIMDEGTGLAGCPARLPKPPDDLAERVTPRRSAHREARTASQTTTDVLETKWQSDGERSAQAAEAVLISRSAALLAISGLAILLALSRAIPPIAPVIAIYLVMWAAVGVEWLIGGRLFEEPDDGDNDEWT